MFKQTILAATISAAAITAQAAEPLPSTADMWKVIQEQQQEIKNLKGQLQQTETKVAATADAVEQSATGKLSKMAEWVEKTKIGGYGEHHFNRFEDKDDKVDAHRFVMFLSHQFSDTVRFFSEIELEHSLAGDGKPGEVELEQAYIEWDYTQGHSVQMGQFLIPVGIMNETHEPDTFYGTERNVVEAKIIPATWWETGIMFNGEIAPGLSYSAAVHSGLETDEANIRSGRQKSANAVANDLAYTARIKYTGVQGLELAATVQYQEDISQGALATADAMLTEVHAIYSIDAFSVRALWAEWDVDGDVFEAAGTDSQEGWYIEPSYKVTDRLGVFARYSEYNNKAGLSSSVDYEIWDYGVNYWLTPNVVLKADYTDYVNDSTGTDDDAFNLGIGWSF
ncbi:porin [Dasania sp. GY-MA-18]|uniref:Porin n=1 Tax=Dasania phycosphaerae TaxID=2950436 RepID=A0A9J6RH33_9GAMM|nr:MULTISPECIES: porin [Dasania]MCR8921327.1 porin [Dasania sp. GY-MA-18]MCZ0863755.1 porin [Dasania phycosphaerae]MCZ0867483.1 porin [Dasania phycosphaerae]